MSSYNYNPVPPRAWSRVQNQCTYIVPDSSYNYAYIPLTGQTVSQAQANYEEKLLYKGNILQYKGNSSQLTKKQKYTQLAKGFGPNRTKVFATQSETYTNPNTTGLLRVNYKTIPFPNELIGQPNNISGPFQYNVPNPFDCSSNSLQDGGNLVCATYANPCTGKIIKSLPISATICNPSYCSDVPGIPIALCWNPNVQTWFPRQRYFMNNSGNKWPEGYKGFVSAVTPAAPVLSLGSITFTTVTLNWTNTSNNLCIPVSSYNIYQNGILIQTVPYTITSTTIYGLTLDTDYSFYIKSVSSSIESKPSNIINVTTLFPFTITTTNYTYNINSNGYLTLFVLSSSILTFLYEIPSIICEAIGGGGGGGGGSLSNLGYGGAGGGGGGASISEIQFTSAANYGIDIIIGNGGNGGNIDTGSGAGNGNQGSQTSCLINGLYTIGYQGYPGEAGTQGTSSTGGNGGNSGSGGTGGTGGTNSGSGSSGQNGLNGGGGGGGGYGNAGGNGSASSILVDFGYNYGAGGGGGVGDGGNISGNAGNIYAGRGGGYSINSILYLNGEDATANYGGGGGGGSSGNGSLGSNGAGGNGGSGCAIFYFSVAL